MRGWRAGGNMRHDKPLETNSQLDGELRRGREGKREVKEKKKIYSCNMHILHIYLIFN